METDEWNALCNNCGGCCNLFKTNVACPLYDTNKHRCSNYDNRLDLVQHCSQLTEDNVLLLHEKGFLPDHCNYVRHMKGQELVWDIEPAQLTPFKAAPFEFQLKYMGSIK